MSNPLSPAVAASGDAAHGTENQTGAIIPRYHLPDDWSGKGTCPVCRTPGQLRVQHQEVVPDRMVCQACGTAFEVDTSGTRIRLAAVPAALAASTASLTETWLMPGELPALIERRLPGDPAATDPPVPHDTPAGRPTAASSQSNLPETAPASAAATPSPQPIAQSQPIETGAAERSPDKATPAQAPKATDAAVAEPGSDDWFATLAAVIGGLAPVKPPPDEVLADELALALAARPEPGSNDSVGHGSHGSAGPAVTDSAQAMAPAATPAIAASSAVPESAEASAPETHALPAAEPEPAAPVVAPEPSTPASPPPGTLPITPVAPIATGVVPVNAGLPAAPAKVSVPRDMAERAWQLHELGNSLPAVQVALESSGATPEQVAVIIAKLAALERARQARFQRNLQWAVAGSLVVIVVLIAVVALLSSGPAPSRAVSTPVPGTPGPGATSVPALTPGASAGTPVPGQAAATATLSYNPIIALLNQLIPGDVKIANGPSPTPTSSIFGGLFPATPTFSPADDATAVARKTSLPSWISTLVPNGITVLNVPTPSVESGGPASSPCPSTADQASALFGGPAASWTFNRQNEGWIFILAVNPTNIRVPANMSAAYLVIGQNLEMRSVTGPATVHNVNFAAVSCVQ